MKYLLCLTIFLSGCASQVTSVGGDNCVKVEYRSAGMVIVDRCVEWRFNPPKNHPLNKQRGS